VVVVLSRTFSPILAAARWLSSVSSSCQGHTETPENKSTDLTEMPVLQKENGKQTTTPLKLTGRIKQQKRDKLPCKLQQTRGEITSRKSFRSGGKRRGKKEQGRQIPVVK